MSELPVMSSGFLLRVISYVVVFIVIQFKITGWRYTSLVTLMFIYSLNYFFISPIMYYSSINNYNIYIMSLVINNFILIIILYFILKKSNENIDEAIKISNIKNFNFKKALKIGFLFWIIMTFINAIIYFSGIRNLFSILSTYLINLRPVVQKFSLEGSISSWTIFIDIIVKLLLLPIFEEVFFRGFLFNFLEDKLGFTKSALLSSIFFATLHPVKFIPHIFFSGLGLTYIYKREKNLLYPIMAHSIYNFIG